MSHLNNKQIEDSLGLITKRISRCHQSVEEQHVASNIVEEIVDCLGGEGVEEGVQALEGDAKGSVLVAVEEVDHVGIRSHSQSLEKGYKL